MCFPRIDITKIFDKDFKEDYWYTKRYIFPFCQATLNQRLVIEPPKLPIPYSNLKQDDLKDIALTIVLLCGHDSD